MPTFLVIPSPTPLSGVCGYCGARRRIAAHARLEGTPGGRSDGEADLCGFCQNKGLPFLEASFIATMPLGGVTANMLQEAQNLLDEIRRANGDRVEASEVHETETRA